MPPKKCPTTVNVPMRVAALATASASHPFRADSGVTKMEGAFTIPAESIMISARIRIPERFTLRKLTAGVDMVFLPPQYADMTDS